MPFVTLALLELFDVFGGVYIIAYGVQRGEFTFSFVLEHFSILYHLQIKGNPVCLVTLPSILVGSYFL